MAIYSSEVLVQRIDDVDWKETTKIRIESRMLRRKGSAILTLGLF
jgi:hypothetical protein